ncbi:MAG: Uma2 family endonuclease [Cyanobacteria bacterium P01_F01_bin.150]
MSYTTLNVNTVKLTDDQFYHLCRANPDRQLELSATGELIIMPPVGGISGNREANLITEVNLWNRKMALGYVFSSSTIFRLPNGGKRSPDVAWVNRERWESLTPKQQEKFPPICPDFVIELRSRTDVLSDLQEKMKEYIDSGLQLGWMLDPRQEQAEIYRPNQDVEIISFPTCLSGETVLPKFKLSLPL